jgi:hypothetical protein
MALLMWLSVAGSAPALAVDVVRARNPDYQASLSDLTEAEQALRRAIAKARASSERPLANVDYQRLLADLRAIEGELAKVLRPHTYAETHRAIRPDSMYFQPPGMTDPGRNSKP